MFVFDGDNINKGDGINTKNVWTKGY